MTVKTIAKATAPYPFDAYSYVISPIAATDGGGYLFTMPDFTGLMADGANVDEAIVQGRDAFASVVSALVDMGREVPAPTLKAENFAPVSASGKFIARVPKTLHAKLTTRAKAEGVSLNSLVLSFIAEGMGRRDLHI